ARRPLPDRHLARLLQGFAQQRERPVAALVWSHEVDLVHVHPVYRVGIHEFRDVDRPRPLLLERLQLVGSELNVAALGELVALDHVLFLDLLTILRADVLLLQAGPVLLVQPVERDRGRRLASRKHLDRDRDEPEGNRGGTNGMRGHRACGERVTVRATALGYYYRREGGSILRRPRGLRPGALLD